MSRARVEIINEAVKIRNFGDIDPGTVFEYERYLYLKTDSGYDAVLLTDDGDLGHLVDFYDDDSVVICDKALITVRTRVE
jgi:hypothetical protein